MPKRSSMMRRLSSAQRRLEQLQDEVAADAPSERFAAELAEVQAQLMELEVAHEELEQQNEELLVTREALEKQRHRYLDLFDRAPFGYLVTDSMGAIEEVNQAAVALLGCPPELLKGQPLSIYVVVESQASFRSFLARARTSREMGGGRMMLKPRGRTPFPAELAVVRDLDGDDKTTRLRWTVHDITEREAAARALRESEERLRHSQRMESIGRLAGGIAHSFNNLLAAIAFQCEILCSRLEEGDERRGHVEEIQKAGDRAAALARQLLAFGRKQVLQPRVLAPNEVIRSLEPMLRRLIGEHIRLETRLDPAAGVLHVDLGQLEQVILNLVVNARDAMASGGTLLLATAGREIVDGEAEKADLPPGSYLELTVADTGTGMPPEVLERLFEPFFTTKETGKGTGLGLATVHGIVHQSGGRIRVESAPGRGTRFTVLLPRAESEAGAAEAPQRPRLARTERRSQRRSEVVLLVEDEENIRRPAVEMLESRGYRVLSAPDATAALALAEGHPGTIHLLITDVIMPGLSGSQLAEQLSSRRPEMRVLYISGYPEDAISHHGVLNPSKHFLQKPFPPGQFLDKVREVLDSVLVGVAAGA
ncbi:MAG TPA: ATP-binding protein [Thermoanaerobaculia bacterium]|nr:ATP-binding protein [Thermoanaerobaculia bacterium]